MAADCRRGSHRGGALPEVAGGRAGRLAEVAGAALGFCQRRQPDTPGSAHVVLSSLASVLREQVEGLGAVVFGGGGYSRGRCRGGRGRAVGDGSKAKDSHRYGDPPALI